MLAAADRLEGIQGGGVASDQGIEEMPLKQIKVNANNAYMSMLS